MIHLSFGITPQPKHRPRVTRGRKRPRKDPRAAAYEAAIQLLVKAQWKGPLLDCPLAVSCFFTIPAVKKPKFHRPVGVPDLDNYVKALFDAFNGVVWRDDSMVVDLHAAKMYANEFHKPGITVLLDTVLLCRK